VKETTMSYEYEPPEPTEEEMKEADAEQAVRALPIEIRGLTTEHVDATIRGLIRSNYRLDERIEEKLDKAIEEHVGSLVAEVTAERIAVAVDAAIAEGFGTYDKYTGRVTGRTSVAEMVSKALTERHSDYSDRNKGTLAEQAVKKAVEELFEKELKSVVAAVAADFKKQADEVFKAKLVASMKEAIGLR
jgi:hypothetical protein